MWGNTVLLAIGSIWTGLWTWTVQMASAFDLSSFESLLTYTCARDLKFSPDPDKTKNRPKPEK